jgi:hypothetical protein
MKDWEERFTNSGPSRIRTTERFLRMLVSFSWAAFIVALVYATLVTWVLLGISLDTDPEGQLAGWIIFGLPWIMVCGRYHWLAVPLNVATVYFVTAAMVVVFRNIFPRRR